MTGRSRFMAYGIPIIAVVALVASFVSIARNQPRRPMVEPVLLPPLQPQNRPELKAAVVQTSSPTLIGAVGLVEPATEAVQIGSHLSGIVTRVFVTPDQKIKAGDILFELDNRAAEATLNARRQDLASAEARLAQTLARIPVLDAQVGSAKSAIAQAEADRADAKNQVEIALSLTGGQAITEREITRRRNALRALDARVEQTKAQLAQAEAERNLLAGPNGAPAVEVDRAAVAQSEAALREAETNRELLTVRSPIDGTVLQVNTRAGQFAQAGIISPALVILGTLEPLHIRIDIDEADVPRFRPGAPAFASLRGAADVRAKISFVRVDPYVVPKTSLTGAGSERVDTRVLRVIYKLDPKSLPAAYPGQQVDIFIEPKEAQNASVKTQ